MTKTLVVLGAGVAGTGIARRALKNTAPKARDLKVIIVTPNTDHYWNLASVRGIVPGQYDDETLFTPLAAAFAQYPKDRYELVIGSAESLNPDASTVVEIGTTDQTKARLGALRKQIAAANKIVIAGGGTTGVEVAGEVGFEFGRKKDVYFVIDKELPLEDKIREDVRRIARKELEKLGVKVIDRSKVTGVREGGAGTGKTILQLTNASGATSELEADAYLPTFGLVPNTSFVPAGLLDKNGLVHQNTDFKVPGYDNLYVVGDAGDLENSTAYLAGLQVTFLSKSLHHRFTGEGKVGTYTPDPKVVAAVTMGRSRGTGQMGTFKLPSLAVWLLKGRYLGTNYNKDAANGKK
ncbi:Oxidoreductase ptaL like protein [Verticillium longisporum]|uniref:Oxidoreductase ptaL like protein n=1 Tax=Verticillium longisporum TaxID=100787 RepID=A0A8I3ARC1_VERLO|nr:Oxidoreductase ptaL like protein [Verticillium longisporum]